jgi:hypothetical protein
MAELSTDTRNRLKSSTFGLPGSRKYPMPDKAHAANAKARATQMVKKGKLSPASAAKIKAKANRKLTGVSADLNAPGNRSPLTPYQEDINSWKSHPVTTRGKWMNNSQGTGRAADTGEGTNYKKQAKFGGTQASSSSKKAQPKVSGGTEATGINYKKQPKFGGTANESGSGNGKRYSNGSSSMDSMKGMIRDH